MSIYIFVLFFLIILSGFFSGSETAFFSVSHLRLHHLVEKNVKNAKLLLKMKEDTNRLLITILIGNNLVNISASAIAGSISQQYFSQYGISIAIGVMTFLILVFGEITPKSFCVRHSETIALKIAPVLNVMQTVMFPVYFILNILTRIFTGGETQVTRPAVTEDMVKSMLDVGEEEGHIKSQETEMIRNVFEMDDTEVRGIMTPRVDMFCLPHDETIGNVIYDIMERGFSRIPVYQDQIDKTVGIVYVKDIMKCLLENDLETKLMDIMKPPIIIPENKVISSLLELFLHAKVHIAMIVDEHGGIEGLVTIEDVIEELVGEIYDEIDQPEKIIQKIDSQKYKLLGKANISDLNSEIDLGIDEDDAYDTISGLILDELGRIPEEKEDIVINNLSFHILKVRENRIIEMLMTIEDKNNNNTNDDNSE